MARLVHVVKNKLKRLIPFNLKYASRVVLRGFHSSIFIDIKVLGNLIYIRLSIIDTAYKVKLYPSY